MTGKDANERIWENLIKVGTMLVWLLAGAVISHEVRLVRIESTRYTTDNALEYERSTNARFEEMHRNLEAIRSDLKVVRAILEREEGK